MGASIEVDVLGEAYVQQRDDLRDITKPQDDVETNNVYQQERQVQQQQIHPLEGRGLGIEETDYERTYLDIFGEMAKEFLTRKLIPISDADCQWNWRHGRCEPSCTCSFQPKPGDFHLGRACRRRLITQPGDCHEQESILSPLSFPHSRAVHIARQWVQQTLKKIQSEASNKLDGLYGEASSKFDDLYGAIQVQVCQDVRQHCMLDDPLEKEEHLRQRNGRVFAWQEQLFCRRIIEDCVFDLKYYSENSKTMDASNANMVHSD